MRVYRLAAASNLVDLPRLDLPPRTQPDAYTIPTIDFSHQKHRQVIVGAHAGTVSGPPSRGLKWRHETITLAEIPPEWLREE